MIELNTIYNEDCLSNEPNKGLNRIPDKSINLILSDLPYGQTSNRWDCQLDLDKLWQQYERIIKDNGAIALTAKGQFMVDLIQSNRKLYRYEWIWNKNKGANFAHAKRMPLNVHEYVLIFYKKQPTYNPQMVRGKPYFQKRANDNAEGIADNLKRKSSGSEDGLRYPKTIIEVEGMAQRHIVHPTQKPITLFEYIINTYSNENDIVLDNCMGSGTTAIACINTHRNYIGFELDQEYYDLTIERIHNAV